MKVVTDKGILVRSYIERFSHTPKLSLARKIYSENALLFKDVEEARSMIRYHTGKTGRRHLCKDPSSKLIGACELPESICKEYVRYEMPKVNNKILCLFDIHFPFHDNNILELALQYGKDHGANTVLLGGDVVDFYSLSWFSHEPNLSTFQLEREMFWQFLDVIDHYMPNAKVIWQEGNHERRYENYLMSKAPEIFDTEEFKLEFLFKCEELGVTYVGDKRVIKIGKINSVHGDEYGNSINTPVNAARNLFLKAKACAIEGHFHATSEHTETDIDGKVITCWSVGCCCGLHPKYRPLNRWNNGFAEIELEKDGNFTVHNHRIVKGKIV